MDRNTRSRRAFVSKMSVYTVKFIFHARKKNVDFPFSVLVVEPEVCT